MTFYRIIFFILLWNMRAHSDQMDIDCFQTSPSPWQASSIKWSADPKTQVIDLSGVDSLIKQAQKDTKTDYTSCLLPVLNGVRFSLASATDMNQSYPWTKKVLEHLLAVTKSFDAYRESHRKLPYPSLPGVHVPNSEKEAFKTRLMKRGLDDININFLLSGSLSDDEISSYFETMQKENDFYARGFQEQLLLKQIENSFPSETKCKAAPDYCEKYNINLKKSLDNLGRINPIIAMALKTTQAENDCSTSRTKVADMRAMIKEIAPCVPLKPNQSYTIRNNQFLGGGDAYSLQREVHPDGTERFVASINFDFPDDQPLPGAKKMEEKVKACFDQVNPFLYNENGISLSLKIVEDGSVPVKTIRTKKIGRANSGQWGSNVNCSTIIHETMHVLGLPDEYEEKTNGVYKPSKNGDLYSENDDAPPNDCRITSPHDSLMNHQMDAFESVAPSEPFTMCVCYPIKDPDFSAAASQINLLTLRMPKTVGVQNYTNNQTENVESELIKTDDEIARLIGIQNKICEKYMPPSTPQSGIDCPDNFQAAFGKKEKKLEEFPWFPDGETNYGYPSSSFILNTSKDVPKAKRKSLLFPAQARSIITGGCTLNNKTYTECAADAYKTSVSRGGRDICQAKNNPNCKDRSPEWLNGAR